MQPNDEQREYLDEGAQRRPEQDRVPVAIWVVIGSVLAGVGGAGYGFYSHGQAARIAESQKTSIETVSEMQQQVQTLRNRLLAQENRERELASALVAAEEEQAAAASKPAAAAPRPVVRKAVATPAREPRSRQPERDPLLSQLERKVSEQDERLESTQRAVESARFDLESRINSTSEELQGSIGRTAEEVAALRRRGERDYFEFDILKSKELQRIGPVALALRKANVKRKRYNVDMLVDDNKLEKKNVNLLEPIYITSPEWPQPLELVVNQVTKDRVAGYISVPKYKRSELASSGSDRARLSPAEPERTPEEE